MSKFRFELNIEGLRDLMKSDEMVEVLDEAAAAVSEASGLECDHGTHEASYVAIGAVWPNTQESAIANSRYNVLLKALGNTLPMTKGD